MQERYSVNYYSPGINIVRNRDEYVDAGLQDYAHVHVVKETRLDGRYRWEACVPPIPSLSSTRSS